MVSGQPVSPIKGTDKLPSKIRAVQPQGNKVVVTINHETVLY